MLAVRSERRRLFDPWLDHLHMSACNMRKILFNISRNYPWLYMVIFIQYFWLWNVRSIESSLMHNILLSKLLLHKVRFNRQDVCSLLKNYSFSELIELIQSPEGESKIVLHLTNHNNIKLSINGQHSQIHIE